MYRLEEKYFHLTGIDNWTTSLKSIGNTYVKKPDIDVIKEEFNFYKLIKNQIYLSNSKKVRKKDKKESLVF